MTGTVLVECGAIRERVSQELARTVFDAVKREIERRDANRIERAVDSKLNRSPLGSPHARAMVDDAREDEQQVGQPVDVAEQHRVDGRVEPDHAAFGAAADGARDVQRRAGRRAAGQNEAAQRRQFGLRADRSAASRRATSSSPIDRLGDARRRACRPGSASWAPSANRSRWMATISASSVGIER